MQKYQTLSDWLAADPLTPHILIVDRLRNGIAAMHMQTLNKKKDVFNFRYLTLRQIAEEILRWELSGSENGTDALFLDRDASVSIVRNILKSGQFVYFSPKLADRTTCTEIFRCIDILRRYPKKDSFNKIVSRDELNGETGDNKDIRRISELKEILECYERELYETDQYDETRLFREALRILRQGDRSLRTLGYLNVHFAVYADARMDPMEEELYRGLCGEDGTVIRVCVPEGYKDPEDLPLCAFCRQGEGYIPKSLSDITWRFQRSYGVYNEIREAAETILRNNWQFGDTALFYPDEVYEDHLAAVFGEKGIPIQFADGALLSEDRAAGMLRYLADWADHNFEEKYLKPVCYSPVLRLADDEDERVDGEDEPEGDEKEEQNQTARRSARQMYRSMIRQEGICWGKERWIDFVCREEKGEGCYSIAFLSFIREAADLWDVSEDGKVSEAEFLRRLEKFARTFIKRGEAQGTLCGFCSRKAKAASRQRTFLRKNELTDYLREILDYLRGSADEPQPGKVILYRMGSRVVTERAHLFVLGLTAKQFGAANEESPVMTVNELEDYVQGAVTSPAEKVKELVYDTSVSIVNGRNVYMSYPAFDTRTMCPNAPASFYADMMRMTGVQKEEKAGYPDLVCEAKCRAGLGELIKMPEYSNFISPEDNVYSATSLQELLRCPKKYYIHRILAIDPIQFHEYVPGRWLEANERGTLVHEILEKYVNRCMIGDNSSAFSEEALHAIEKECVESVCRTMKPYPSVAVLNAEVREIHRGTADYLERLADEISGSPWHPLFTEEELQGEMGTEVLKLQGRIDRIDGCDEGGGRVYRIIDYKTGRKPKEDDGIKRNELKIQAAVYTELLNRMIEKGKIPEGKVREAVFEYIMEEGADSRKICFASEDSLDFLNKSTAEVFDGIRREKYYSPELSVFLSDSVTDRKKINKNRSERCKYCDYNAFCMDGSEKR